LTPANVQADAAALPLLCPSAAVLTLVENAVRHGIDPAEDGGRIDVAIRLNGARLRVRVADTGIGLGASAAGGTGLANLRERLALTFGGDASVTLDANLPRGVVAKIDLPARSGPAA
jgi:LytS/YehU family sensor histidine kinase